MTRTILLSLCTAAAMAMTPQALAQTDDRYEARIAYGDLDLSREAGANVLMARIDAAAREACGVRSGRVSLREHRLMRECVAAFAERAVAAAPSSAATSQFAERGEGIAPMSR